MIRKSVDEEFTTANPYHPHNTQRVHFICNESKWHKKSYQKHSQIHTCKLNKHPMSESKIESRLCIIMYVYTSKRNTDESEVQPKAYITIYSYVYAESAPH